MKLNHIDKKEIIYMALIMWIFILFIMMGLMKDNLEYENTLLRNKYQTYEMCGRRVLDAEFGVNGIYVAQKYYCVWTQGREQEMINNTALHESCHAMINEDRGHFLE